MDNAGIRAALVAAALSASGLVYIAQREDFRSNAYADPVHGTAVPTIGFGSTQGVKMGDTITPTRGLVRLRVEAGDVEIALKRCLPNQPVYPREWDALVGLAHNAGVTSVCKNNDRNGPSTIARRLAAQDYKGMCEAILLYDRAGPANKPQDRCSHPDNRTCRGVWVDRQKLRAMCLGEAMP